MTDMDRMLAWLREALDAAQHDAEAAAKEEEADWSNGGEHGETVTTVLHGSYVAVGPWDCPLPDGIRRHIARHDPAAVLRRIVADRRALARHQPFQNLEIVDMPKVGHVTRCAHDKQHWPCPDITDLAEAWGWTEEQQR